ncbi:FecR family protein [uncultured Bacteroides sp.]|uniref:FecR family protein n=1 Tax=uncultured Bacteroides sp. TaxID=162156 RepID=UPI002AA88A0E|nr:FecR family protein [uncultured Bacteroides sp.]
MNKELLYRFFNGEASLEEEVKVKTWIEESEENRREFLRERKLFDLMIFRGEGGNRVKVQHRLYRKRVFLECLKVASVIVVTLLMNFLYFHFTGERGKEEIAMQTVNVPYGQRVNLSLSDGTTVWLNSGSHMSYPESFAKGGREVYLDGEAYFEVAHNKKRPFTVHAGKYDVEVLGTKFNVDAYSKEGTFESSLLEGKIKLISRKDQSSLMLAPSYKAVRKGEKLFVSRITDYDVYRWKEGLICFKNKSFTDILKSFEKYYDLRIVIENMKLKNPLLTGKFRLSDGAEYALKVLQKDVNFKYTRNIDDNIIYIR